MLLIMFLIACETSTYDPWCWEEQADLACTETSAFGFSAEAALDALGTRWEAVGTTSLGETTTTVLEVRAEGKAREVDSFVFGEGEEGSVPAYQLTCDGGLLIGVELAISTADSSVELLADVDLWVLDPASTTQPSVGVDGIPDQATFSLETPTEELFGELAQRADDGQGVRNAALTTEGEVRRDGTTSGQLTLTADVREEGDFVWVSEQVLVWGELLP